MAEVRKLEGSDPAIGELIAKMKGMSIADETYRVLYNRAMRLDDRWADVLRAPRDRVFPASRNEGFAGPRERAYGPAWDGNFPPRFLDREPPPHAYRNENAIFGATSTTTRPDIRRCFGCGKDGHTINRCEEIQKHIDQGTISRNSYRRWVWKDGTDVERRRGETWVEAIWAGVKHVGIATAVRIREKDDRKEDENVVMYIEADQEEEDADERDQDDLGWRNGTRGSLNQQTLAVIRSERVSRNERNNSNNKTNSHRTANETNREPAQ